MAIRISWREHIAKDGKIHRYARPHLRSRYYGIELNCIDGEGEGFIACGFHSGGDFSIRVTPSPDTATGKGGTE